MFNFIQRLRHRWRLRRLRAIREGLIRYADPSNPKTQWQIDAIGQAIEAIQQEAAKQGEQAR